MKKHIIIGLAILIFVQLAVPFAMIAKREKVLNQGELVRFKVRGFDPADIMRGRYLQYTLVGRMAYMPEDSTKDFIENQKVYATIKRDSLGIAKFDWVSKTKPEDKLFMTVRFSHAYRPRNPKREKEAPKDTVYWSNVITNAPLERFYLDEDYADIADTLLRRMTDQETFIDVRILDGYPVVEEFYIEDIPLMEYLRDVKLGKR